VWSLDTPRTTYTASCAAYYDSLAPGYTISALHLSHFDPFEATVLFRHIFKEARRSSVILLPSSSTSCTVLDILRFYAQRTLGRPPFLSPLCGIWKHGVGKTKRSSIGRRRSSCTLLRKHTFCWIAGCGAKDFYSLHISARNICSLS
jgi:hypothetical protein